MKFAIDVGAHTWVCPLHARPSHKVPIGVEKAIDIGADTWAIDVKCPVPLH